MKKIFTFILLFLIMFLLTGCFKGPALKLHNWGEYIDESLIYDFEAKTGTRINIIPFSDNEGAINNVLNGNQYDIIVPSEYSLENLVIKDKLEKIDWSKIKTFNKNTDFSNTLSELINKLKNENNYDILEYGIPYFWGNVGIIYNKDTINESILTGWDALIKAHDLGKKVALYNSSRDMYMIALKAQGYSPNTQNISEIDEATIWLKRLKNADIISDQILTDMPSGKYDIAVCYSGDASYIIKQAKKGLNLGYYVPKEGTNIWLDLFVIPKGANQELAYKFINYMLEYENAYDNSLEVGYASPVKKVLERIINETSGEIKKIYQIDLGQNDEIFRYIPENKRLIQEAFTRFKANK